MYARQMLDHVKHCAMVVRFWNQVKTRLALVPRLMKVRREMEAVMATQ